MTSRVVGLLSSLGFLLAFGAGETAANPREGEQIWAMAVLQGGFGFLHPKLDRMKGYLELQGRWRGFGQSLDTAFLPRAAVGYAITPQMTAYAGFANVQLDPVRARPYGELRPYQQLTWNVPFETLGLQSRTRLEERIIDENLGWRIRELVKATVTIPGIERVYFAAYDEMFFELDDTSFGQRKGLRQNRFFAGPGFHVDPDKHLALELGYLNQWIDRKQRDRENHVMSLNLFVSY